MCSLVHPIVFIKLTTLSEKLKTNLILMLFLKRFINPFSVNEKYRIYLFKKKNNFSNKTNSILHGYIILWILILMDKTTTSRKSKISRQTIPECSSPQLISTTGSFLMKKWLGMLSAKLLLPYVKTAPVSEIRFNGN